jgi:hypothetical protein
MYKIYEAEVDIIWKQETTAEYKFECNVNIAQAGRSLLPK